MARDYDRLADAALEAAEYLAELKCPSLNRMLQGVLVGIRLCRGAKGVSACRRTAPGEKTPQRSGQMIRRLGGEPGADITPRARLPYPRAP